MPPTKKSNPNKLIIWIKKIFSKTSLKRVFHRDNISIISIVLSLITTTIAIITLNRNSNQFKRSISVTEKQFKETSFLNDPLFYIDSVRVNPSDYTSKDTMDCSVYITNAGKLPGVFISSETYTINPSISNINEEVFESWKLIPSGKQMVAVFPIAHKKDIRIKTSIFFLIKITYMNPIKSDTFHMRDYLQWNGFINDTDYYKYAYVLPTKRGKEFDSILLQQFKRPI